MGWRCQPTVTGILASSRRWSFLPPPTMYVLNYLQSDRARQECGTGFALLCERGSNVIVAGVIQRRMRDAQCSRQLKRNLCMSVSHVS